MSLQTLPPELFLHIMELLQEAEDRNSLRITCRKFANFIQPPAFSPTWPGILKRANNSYSTSQTALIPSRLNFISRLFLPGNIFYGRHPEVKCCGNCCLVRPSTKFPLDMIRDGYRICEGCLFKILLDGMGDNASIIYKEKTHKCCYYCLHMFAEEHVHHCFGYVSGDAGVYLCLGCHFDECLDPRCPCWETEDLLQVQSRFCTNYDDEESCGHCEECQFIEELRRTEEAKSKNDSDYNKIED